MSKMEMHLLVPVALVGPIIELVSDQGIVVSVNSPKLSTKRTFRGGKRLKGIHSFQLIKKVIQEAPTRRVTIDTLQQAFEKEGFAKSSAWSSLTKLVHLGEVKKDGKYFSLA